MKTVLLAALGCAALVSLPAEAGHGHYRGRHYAVPYVSFGYGFGHPYGYRRYAPYWHYPHYYYPSYLFGLNFDLGPRSYRTRTEPRREPPEAARLYVYPAAGQSEEQTAQDRYECHTWAAEQTGFDPTLGDGTTEQSEGYYRAHIACLEGRDYVVK
jgi:hypothetical protein